MKLKKSILALALASVSAPALAIQEIDELVNTSSSIRATFDYGIRAIGGMTAYAATGGIAPIGTVNDGIITADQANAYNASLVAVQNATYIVDVGAQDYFDNAANQAMNNVNEAVDAYVAAAQAVIEVVRVNEIAADAQAAGDGEALTAVQDYIANNDVTLEQNDVDIYNDALVTVEENSQTAAAFMAVANDPTLIESANQQADSMGSTYAEAVDSFFSVEMGEVIVSFEGVQDSVVVLMVNSYFVPTADILAEGESSNFYLTGPTYNPCAFFQDPTQVESCQGG